MKSPILSVGLLFFIISNLQAQLACPYEVTNTMRPFTVFNADMNGDGLTDIVGSSGEGVAWMECTGDGTYEQVEHLIYYGGGSNEGIYLRGVDDIDADGDVDLIMTRGYGQGLSYYNTLYALRSEGGLVFGESEMIDSELSNLHMDFGDLNGDGLKDIVLVNEMVLKIYFNTGTGDFELADTWGIVGEYVSNTRILDFNQDGYMDFVYNENGYSDLHLFLGNDNGSFDDGGVVFSSEADYGIVDFTDLTNDNLPDMIFRVNIGTWQEPLYALQLAINNGNNDFGIAQPVNSVIENWEYVSLKICDWNSDGVQDVLAFESGLDSEVDCTIHFMEWIGDLELVVSGTQSFEMQIGSNLTSISFDSDITPEFFVFDYSNEWKIINLENGEAQLIRGLDDSMGINHTEVVEDLDGDGDLDIISVCGSSGKLGWYKNQGVGFASFELIYHFEVVSTSPPLLHVIDLDSDDDMDILVRQAYSSPGILVNEGGIFQPPLFSQNDDYIGHWGSIDANLDQYADFILSTETGGIKLITGGMGDFFNQSGVNLSTSVDKWIVTDLDHDEDKDILFGHVNGETYELTEILNNGEEFASWNEVTSTIDSQPFSSMLYMNTIDYNNDGWEDLITYSIPSWLELDVYTIVRYNGPDGFLQSDTVDFIPLTTSNPFFDFDNDGLKDILTHDEWGYVLNRNLGNGQFEFFGTLPNYSPGWIETEFYDFDADGDLEFFGVTQDEIIIYDNLIMEFVNPVEGHVFNDWNGNGIEDASDDVVIGMDVLVESDDEFTYLDGQGYFYLNGQTGVFDISPVYDPTIWELTTDSASYHVVIENPGETPNYSLDFGLHPVGDSPEANLFTVATGWVCALDNFTLNFGIQNTGNTYLDGLITLTFDETMTNPNYFVQTPDSVVGNTVYWTISELVPSDMQVFEIVFNHPGIEFIGEILNFSCHFERTIELDELPLVLDQQTTLEVTCAYDPNDKSVAPAGFDAEGYIEANTELIYTVRFQNTGNDTATTVIIVDQLSSFLNYDTFELLGASHNVDVLRSEDGLLTFYFNNIMLPDSGANYLESNGFVVFKVQQLPDMQPGTAIQNTAFIYFDTNPAIVTNSVLNTIYTCDWLYSDLQVMMIDEFLTAPPGAASYQWYMDGTLIPNETSSTISPVDGHSYTVELTFENGCVVMTNEFVFSADHIITSFGDDIIVYPNPTREMLFVNSPFGNVSYSLIDALGQITSVGRLIGGNNGIEIENLKAGLYMMQFTDKHGSVLKVARVLILH